MSGRRDPSVQHLEVTATIARLTAQYCRALDRLDPELLRSLFAEGASIRYATLDGTLSDRDPSTFASDTMDVLATMEATQHIITSQVVQEVADDEARAETYVVAIQCPAERPAFVTSSRFLDHFIRDGDRWCISERRAVRAWIISDVPIRVPTDGQGPLPRRDRGDLAYGLT